MTTTVDQARDALVEAKDNYLAIEETIKKGTPGLSTPERVLANIEHEAAYREAAMELVEAKATYEQVKAETDKRIKTEAETKLIEVEAQLIEAVGRADAAMDALEAELATVVNLSKARYGYTRTARGRAGRSLLARGQIAGWLRHRLSGLELADLGHAEPHHRRPLGELLGLDTQPNPPTTDGDDQ